MAAVAPVRPPKEIPSALKEKVDTLHNSVQVLFVSKQIPWIIQAKMAEDGYVTMEDLACRWVSAEKAREEGPKDLQFRDGENGFDKSNSDFSAMRLYQAVVQARSLLHSGKASSLSDGVTRPTTGFNLDALCDRVALEKDWVWNTREVTASSRNNSVIVPKVRSAILLLSISSHSQNHSFKPFGNGNQRLSPQANPTSFSVALHIYSIASLRKTTIIQPLTLLRAPGGGQVMQVPQTVERHTLGVGSATTQTQQSIRYGGFHYQVKEDQHLGPSRTASPSVALQLWKCWVHSFSRCTYVRRVRPSGDRCFYPWPVITRAISTGCWMTTRERCLQLACSWKSCSNSRLRVVVWCHPMWRETTTNGQMISLTLLLKGLTLRWNLWLHHYSQSSRSFLGYYNILMHKVIFLDRSQSSLPLLLRRWRRGGSASIGFGWSYSPRTLSWERYISLILTLPTCGLRTGDLVGLCQLLALLVRLDILDLTQKPLGSFWHLPTGQSCTNWHPNTEGKSTAASAAWVLSEC